MQGTLIHAGIHPRHAPRGVRLVREHQAISQRTRPSAPEIFEAREILASPAGYLPAIPNQHIHPRHKRSGGWKVDVKTEAGEWERLKGIRDFRLSPEGI